jgi:hypothetical protein
MGPAGRTARVVLAADPAAEAEEIALLMERLRAEVAERDFDLVADPAPSRPPTGAKAGDPAAAASLLIALAASGGVLTSLVGLLQGWVQRSAVRGLVVEIDGDRLELTGATSAERRRLTQVWLDRHERDTDRRRLNPDSARDGGATGP